MATVSVGIVPAPSRLATISVGTVTAPSRLATIAVGIVPAPSRLATVSVGIVTAPSRVATVSVSIVTRYGLDGPGIESRRSEIFRSRPTRPWNPPSLLYNRYRVSFPGIKRPRRGLNHPPPSSAEVKERVETHRYSPSGPSWPVLG